MANNRKCLLCGNEYSYCPTCSADRNKPTWMNSFDKENCKVVFETLSAYGMKVMTVSEAKMAIKNIDINSMNLNEQKKETIKEILGNKSSVVETPVVEVKEVAETPTPEVDVVTTEEVVEEPVEAKEEVVEQEVTENVEAPVTYKKRNKNNYFNKISE